jgi:fructose-1,6-bisphosphatase I
MKCYLSPARRNFRSTCVAICGNRISATTSNGRMPIFGIQPEGLEQRAPVFIGCREDVEKALEFIYER